MTCLRGAPRLVEHGSECRIVAQRVVVDQVLVAECDAEDALAQEISYGVADGSAKAKIGEARGEPTSEPRRPIGRGQQHHAAIRGDRAAIEGAHKFASARASEVQLVPATVCRHRGTPSSQIKSFSQNNVL